ncbi:MAG: TVP38/TMEM64 family protein [Myxococcota bacterium]
MTDPTPQHAQDLEQVTWFGPKWKGALAALVLVTAVVVYVTMPVEQFADDVLRWVQGLGAWSYLAFFGLYILVAVVLIPASVLTIGAGFLYGPIWGVIIVSAASTAGAAVAFLLGRTVAHDWAAERVEDFPRFNALYRAIQKDDFKVVLLARLVPVVPYNILNYAFSLTKVGFKRYVFASWLGMLPATVVYVYVGAAAKNLTRVAAGDVEVGWLQIALFVLAGAAAIAVSVLLMRRARREFEEMTRENDPDVDQDEDAH